MRSNRLIDQYYFRYCTDLVRVSNHLAIRCRAVKKDSIFNIEGVIDCRLQIYQNETFAILSDEKERVRIRIILKSIPNTFQNSSYVGIVNIFQLKF